MKDALLKLGIIVFFTAIAPVARAQQGKGAGDPLPTMQEIQALFDAGQWQPLLQKSSRVLSLRGQAADSYDKYQILMMRGEAQLNLKANTAAVQAFNDAAKAAKTPEDTAAARASALLVKRSNAGQYTRKTPTTQPSDSKTISVTDRAKRKEAFVALADDEAAALDSKAKSATKGDSLKPIADMFQSVEDLRSAELAGTGKTDRTDGVIGPLADRAKDLTSNAVQQQKRRVDKIEQSANKIIDYDSPIRNRTGNYGGSRYPTEKRYRKQGLIGTDQNDLKDVINMCKQIEQANKQLAEAFGDKLGKPLLDIGNDAKTQGERADKVLHDDYSHNSSDPNGLK